MAVLAEGDPLFYGSYMHMHKRLAHRYATEVVPGVTSVSAAAARLGAPLAEGDEVLTVLPGTLPEEELTARLAATDAAVVMKLGRTFPKVRRALEAAGTAGRGAVRGARHDGRRARPANWRTWTRSRCRTSRWPCSPAGSTPSVPCGPSGTSWSSAPAPPARCG